MREDPPSADLMAALAPFGGGMGSSGDVCGTLAGALAVLGLSLGKTRPEQRDHKLMMKLSHRMVLAFEEICHQYGSTRCRDIAGVDWQNRVQVIRFYASPEKSRANCRRVIRETVRVLEELSAKLDDGKKQRSHD